MVSKRVCQHLSVLLLLLLLAGPGTAQNSSSQAPEKDAEASESREPSRAELVAAGYLRTLWAAQQEYNKKNARYATSLGALVGHGSFTKRMASTDRRDYTVRFRSDGKRYSAELIPKQYDDEHPAFYMDETGVVRSEHGSQATAASAEVRRKQ